MAKAVLIMDMPENCMECPIGDEELNICCRDAAELPNNCEYRKPDWCPLIPEPKREKDWLDKDTKVYPESFYIGYCTGFNACLDALEGKE